MTSQHGSTGAAQDPVANFHLRNGARVERVNFLGDRGARGAEQSFGMMVNYLYSEKDIGGNSERYEKEGKIATGENLISSFLKLS